MQTIGQLLKSARINKRHSLKKLEDITKIKADFIESIEKEKWEELPPFPTVFGFVRSLSTALVLDDKKALAILKRDYPPKKLNISPKPDVASKFVWTPKLTFILGIIFISFLTFGYLVFQYKQFISPPSLRVESPVEGQIISGNSVLVFGSTDNDSKIVVNNQPVLVDEEGKFSVNLEVASDTKEVVVEANSRSGKETVIRRTIIVK